MLKTVFIVCALVCFLLKALSISIDRIDFMNLGFAFLTATLLV
jgi:hypothetical protein